MKKIYTVYQLNEKRNKLGNPYIGMSEDLITRGKTWKCKLKLDYIPELIPLHTETDGQRCFNWEQDKRVELGWSRERSYRHQKNMRKNAHKILQNKEHQSNAAKWKGKKGFAAMSKEKLVEIKSLATIALLNSPNNWNKQKRKCIYCGFETTPGNIGRHHNENCRFK